MLLYLAVGDTVDFYDKDGNIVHYEGKKLPKKSSRSDFYEIDENTLLKVFISFLSRNIWDIEVFNKLMEINHDNFYKIFKLLYNLCTGKDKELYDGNYVHACLIQSHKQDVDNILEMPIEYFLDNFSNLYELTKIISQKYIRMYDLHGGNIILNKDRMVIIDADYYYRYDSPFVFDYNKKDLFTALRGIMLEALKNNYSFSDPYDRLARVRVIDNIFNYSNNPTIVKSMIRSYKKPIDYINRSVNR